MTFSAILLKCPDDWRQSSNFSAIATRWQFENPNRGSIIQPGVGAPAPTPGYRHHCLIYPERVVSRPAGPVRANFDFGFSLPAAGLRFAPHQSTQINPLRSEFKPISNRFRPKNDASTLNSVLPAFASYP